MFGQKNIPSVIGKMNTGKRVLRGPAEAACSYSGNPRVVDQLQLWSPNFIHRRFSLLSLYYMFH